MTCLIGPIHLKSWDFQEYSWSFLNVPEISGSDLNLQMTSRNWTSCCWKMALWTSTNTRHNSQLRVVCLQEKSGKFLRIPESFRILLLFVKIRRISLTRRRRRMIALVYSISKDDIFICETMWSLKMAIVCRPISKKIKEVFFLKKFFRKNEVKPLLSLHNQSPLIM